MAVVVHFLMHVDSATTAISFVPTVQWPATFCLIMKLDHHLQSVAAHSVLVAVRQYLSTGTRSSSPFYFTVADPALPDDVWNGTSAAR